MDQENISIKNSIEVMEKVIKSKILVIRGEKVILDKDLAELYEVTTKRFNEQVKRNIERFPNDFMFRLTEEENYGLNRSQNATGSQKHRDPRFLPYAFTEHGVAMLSSVLNSKTAIQMNILIIRIFIKIKEWIISNKDLELRVDEIEKIQRGHSESLDSVDLALRHIMEEPIKPPGKIGFN